jgi:hypothetical protein
VAVGDSSTKRKTGFERQDRLMADMQPTGLLPPNNLSDVLNRAAALANLLPSGVSMNAAGEVSATHFLGSGSTPTAATGSAMGSGGSLTAPTVVGTDVSFQVTLTTGLSTTAGTLFTITFANSFTTTPPAPLVFGANSEAISQTQTHNYVASCPTAGTLTVTVTSGLSSNSTYVFNIRP